MFCVRGSVGRYIFIRRRAATSISAPIGPRIQPYRSTVSGISSRTQSLAKECPVGSASIKAYLVVVDTLLTAAIQTGLLPTPPSLRASISDHQPPDRGGAVHCRILIYLATIASTRKTNELLLLDLADRAQKEISSEQCLPPRL